MLVIKVTTERVPKLWHEVYSQTEERKRTWMWKNLWNVKDKRWC